MRGDGVSCAPCVAELSSPEDRLLALREALAAEPEPLVTLTRLLRLCRDEHAVLWERVSDAPCRQRVAAVLEAVARELPAAGTAANLDAATRHALAASLEPVADVPPVVVAHALAQLLEERYGHTFAVSFRRRSPYRPAVGDLPLDSPDLRAVMDMPATSPPWRLANRLDETRHVRLAGEWVVQFQVVFDYSLHDILAGLITADTVVATCHPNRSLREFDLTPGAEHRTFPVCPLDPRRQRAEVDRLIARATAAGASIVVLPELSVTESLALELQAWVRRPDGPRLLIAGSYHHQDDHPGDGPLPGRRRNTAIGWVRGHDRALTHDKHSAADRPVLEDIQPQGWPEMRVYVTADGWHLVLAICRDLLNPQAMHALTEAGANLVLVPAMSETLMPFGGPTAQLVGACQALVAVANNPSEWGEGDDPSGRRPARALFGHPGFGQQTRYVPSQDSGPGVALLTMHSAEVSWLGADRDGGPDGQVSRCRAPDTSGAEEKPAWLGILAAGVGSGPPVLHPPPEGVWLRPAAVLVLLTDGDDGPAVLLTERAGDLADYPGRIVFPGGAVEVGDDGPVATALREAGEEVGLDPDTVTVIGLLAPLALPGTGFLVYPVLAWSAQPTFSHSANHAEVTAVRQVPLRELATRSSRVRTTPGVDRAGQQPSTDLNNLGDMTGTVIDRLLSIQARGEWRLSLSAVSGKPTASAAQPLGPVAVAGDDGAAVVAADHGGGVRGIVAAAGSGK